MRATSTNFIEDTIHYALQVKQFKRNDWIAYILWVGMMSGLLFCTLGFTLVGYFNGVEYPGYVWNVPVGTFIFITAIAFDTIGHRTAYKEELKKGEALVHHITIFAGVSSIVVLCLAYDNREFWNIPALVLTGLAVFYSMIDEGLHWRRYFNGYSDRVEMWSHFFIFLGHNIMGFAWYWWFIQGYKGVPETIAILKQKGIL